VFVASLTNVFRTCVESHAPSPATARRNRPGRPHPFAAHLSHPDLDRLPPAPPTAVLPAAVPAV